MCCLKAMAQVEISERYKKELLQQIQAKEEQKHHERQEYLEEGRRLREEAARGQQRLLQIKEKKLRELEELGVPPKYRAELERKKVTIS